MLKGASKKNNFFISSELRLKRSEEKSRSEFKDACESVFKGSVPGRRPARSLANADAVIIE